MNNTSNNLFFENKVLKLNDLFYYQLGCLMYQARVHEIPQVLQSMFRQNDRVHNHSTRQSSSFHLPLLRTRLAQNTLIYCMDLLIGTTLTQIFSKLAHLNLLNEILKFI